MTSWSWMVISFRQLHHILLTITLLSRGTLVQSQWWFLSRLPTHAAGLQPSVTSVAAWCNSAPGLVKRQRMLCRQSPAVMLVLVNSGRLSLRECQHHFRSERWNCSALSDTADSTGVNKFMKQGTREAAFVYAVSSAAFVHSITRACSAGKMRRCSCDPMRRYGVGHDIKGQFQWGGCSDHMKFGARYARKFLDARYRAMRGISMPGRRARQRKRPNSQLKRARATLMQADSSFGGFMGDAAAASSDAAGKLSAAQAESVRAMMNLHNNRAGRRAVMKHKRLLCKCHGVSGACSMRTCWRAMHDMRVISGFLRRKFDGAIPVKPSFGGGRLELLNFDNGYQMYYNNRMEDSTAVQRKQRRPTKSTLVYLHKSPNYCVLNSDVGVTGTGGRECNNTSTGSDSCAILCCGSGYDTFSVTMTHKCKCKFYWCCKVKCKLCTGVVEKHRCKASRAPSSNLLD